MERVQSGFGLLAVFAIAWAISENRRMVRPQIVLVGIGMQLAIAAVVLHVPALRAAFVAMNGLVLALQSATDAGTGRSEEHTSELQALMRTSYAVFCLKKKSRKTKSPPLEASGMQATQT